MIKTILAFGYVGLSMIFLLPFGLFAVLFHFIGFKKSMARFVYWFARIWARILIKISGCTITVTGVENIPQNSGLCFVSNHDSYFDIVLMLAYSGRPIGFIAKKELLFIPFLNCWIYMIGGLFIDRKNVRKAILTINRGVQRLKSGSAMIIFPEGHRSKGRGLLPFHPGSLKLATMSDTPIVPVAIKDSSGVFEKNGCVKSVPIEVHFLEPIDTSEMPSSDKKLVLSDKIYSVIKEKLSADSAGAE
ncbi:MAG: 1-acyl-sn-glycerol-3-phosphate acyltransferase [Treponema sp.]|nr:1-acyl-sn-glycerol-3-phosphate acyltransferase [Treponema sp.]